MIDSPGAQGHIVDMVDRAQKQAEIGVHFKAFQRMLPELMATRAGKFALLRQQALVQFFDTPRDALVFGQQVFPDGVFSIQEVTQKLIDQGWFSFFAGRRWSALAVAG